MHNSIIQIFAKISSPSDAPMFTWHHIFTSHYRTFIYFVLILSVYIIPVLMIIDYLQNSPSSNDQLSQHHLQSIEDHKLKQNKTQQSLIIPSPFPFPVPHLKQHHKRFRSFRIPDAEFELKVNLKSRWKKTILSNTVVRFTSQNTIDGELTFSAECFGRCDQMEHNIQYALRNTLSDYFHQGKTVRVTHRHIHHKNWVEFSLLYQDTQGQYWLHGTSLRANQEDWIHGLKCEYRAPIDFSVENEEVLHFLWDEWVPSFIRMCRDYKIKVRDY